MSIELLTELAKAKAMFQQQAISAVLTESPASLSVEAQIAPRNDVVVADGRISEGGSCNGFQALAEHGGDDD